jgi:hypothetical protein
LFLLPPDWQKGKEKTLKKENVFSLKGNTLCISLCIIPCIEVVYKPFVFIVVEITINIKGNLIVIIMGKKIEMDMKIMSFKTKMRENKGSMLVTIPKGLVKLLKVESGDKLLWNADITNDKLVVTVEPLKESE